MIGATNQNRRRGRIGRTVLFGTVLLASFAGAYAYRTLFARPGESALQFVPADASLVVSIDLSPSPTQTLVFKHIDDALARNGLERFTENSILEMVNKSPLTAELSPLVKRGGAACMEQKPGKPGEYTGLIFISVTDGAKALDIIKKHSQVQFYKGARYYKVANSTMAMSVIDDFLVLSDSPAEFLRVKDVQEGTLKSITTVPEFVAARDQVASDANLLVFASPKLWADIVKDKVDASPNWMAASLAVRDGGIGLSMAGKTDLEKYPEMRAYAGVHGIRTDLFQVMPEGSYGMFAVSDPSTIFNVTEKTLTKNKDTKKSFKDAEDSAEKSLGLSIKDDLLPAFKGDEVAAIYPSQSGETVGLDVLAIIDDENGGDPASAVQKFQAFMDKQSAKEGNAPKLFKTRAIEGGLEYRINDKIEADMQKGLGDGIDPAEVNKGSLVANKTIVFDTLGKTVIAASSQSLLDRAVASYRSKTNGLVGDAKFGPYEKTLLDGSQTIMAFSISRIAEGVKNTVHTAKMGPDSAKLFNSIFSALETLKEPLYVKGKTSQDGLGSAGLFIPMDFDKLFDIIGEQMKKK